MPFNMQDLTNVRAQLTDATAQHAEADANIDALRAAAGDATFAVENRAKIEEAIKARNVAREQLATLALMERDVMADLAGSSRQVQTQVRDAKEESAFRKFSTGDLMQRFRAEGFSAVRDKAEELLGRDASEAMFQGRAFDAAAGAGLRTPDYKDIMVEQLVRRPRIGDFVTYGTTDTDVVDYTTETARTDTVAYADYGSTTTASAYGFEHAQTTVSRLTSFIKATEGQLMDAGQTETLLRMRLASGARLKLETEIWAGDGTGSGVAKHLTGITVGAGTGTTDGTGLTRLDAVNQAITDIQVASLMNIDPRVLFIHPTDYQQLVLEKDNQNRYLLANPTGSNLVPIWGLIPVVTPLVTLGTPWVADPTEYVVWLRSGTELSVSDNVDNDFLTGLRTIKTETRLASANLRPAAFRKISNFAA